jgi:hypothetical protein
MEKLIQQIEEKGFKPILYSIFNYMEENGYIIEMESQFSCVLGPSDFEYMVFTLTESEKNGLKYRVKSVISRFEHLKNILEAEKTGNNKYSKCILFILKNEMKVFLVKFKDYDLFKNVLRDYAKTP